MLAGAAVIAGVAIAPSAAGAAAFGGDVRISRLTQLKRASNVAVLIHVGPPSQPFTLGGASGSWPMRCSQPIVSARHRLDLM